ncbi:DUF3040 domain-containing protein [Amycolatopsis benzoatilytica]|uniref:DUF3040 domain-containing protein n=1 Tax=Amycolatopsis benzoatilytica TaxID=346045 RepID=UPI0003691085|nr:DUF3040 domain-containing protein [Amycolatopsis benzoatilytica]
MTLRDHEQRQLDEIERILADENPRLAHRFEKFRPMHVVTFAAATLSVLSLLLAGLTTMVVGFGMGSLPPILAGAAITLGVPLVSAWYYRCRWR